MLLKGQDIKNSLVIFKSKPAKVISVLDKKIEIETLDGKNIKLPPKNVQLLVKNHRDFELNSLKELVINELELTWKLLQEQNYTTIEELGELLFGRSIGINEAYTVWLLISQGEYFSFDKNLLNIIIHSSNERDLIVKDRKNQQKKDQEINAFIERVKHKSYAIEDENFLKEIESLATLKTSNCRILKYLNIEESANNAYKLLLDIGYHDEFYNPYLYRYKTELESNNAIFKYNTNTNTNTNRVNLTHLISYAIDNEGSNDPDDAISWDMNKNKMWVHIADTSSIISFGDKVDLEARIRGSNLYIPEKIIYMLPEKATENLGLGLKDISPALSISFTVNEQGDIQNIEICFSNIKVTRYSYEFADKNIKNLKLGNIIAYTKYFTKKRLAQNAVEIDFNEIKISINDKKKVQLIDLPRLKSRTLIRDTMLMAGVAIGQFCIENNISIPFSTQEEHNIEQEYFKNIPSIADMFDIRHKLKRSQYSTTPRVHAGLGLDIYVQVTSPLRRYLDLIVHYQLRNYLNQGILLKPEEIDNIITQVDISIRINKQTERFSNTHWKLVYLLQNPNLKFEGTVIKKLKRDQIIVYISNLSMTKKISVKKKYELNQILKLQNTSVNLITQEAFFNIIDKS